MAIMALMAVVVGPWFMRISQRNQLKSAAREIQSTLLAARMKAVKRNAPVTVLIASMGPPIVLQTVEPPPAALTPTPVPARLELPAKSAQLIETPNSAGGAIVFGGDGRLANFSNATAPFGATMTIQGPIGAANTNDIFFQIRLNGKVTVRTPVVWK